MFRAFSPSSERIHGTLYALFFTLGDISQIPVQQAGGIQESTATLLISILFPFLKVNKDLMDSYGICYFVIFLHSECTTSSTITSTWRARLLLQPGWFRGCLWFIWHSKPGYCIAVTWSHGILIMIHFTSTIVLPVKHAIQFGLNHSHACDCDCSISQMAWILCGFVI